MLIFQEISIFRNEKMITRFTLTCLLSRLWKILTLTWWIYEQVWQSLDFLNIRKKIEKKKLKKKFKNIEILLKIAKFFGKNRTKSGTALIETTLTGNPCTSKNVIQRETFNLTSHVKCNRIQLYLGLWVNSVNAY